MLRMAAKKTTPSELRALARLSHISAEYYRIKREERIRYDKPLQQPGLVEDMLLSIESPALSLAAAADAASDGKLTRWLEKVRAWFQ